MEVNKTIEMMKKDGAIIVSKEGDTWSITANKNSITDSYLKKYILFISNAAAKLKTTGL